MQNRHKCMIFLVVAFALCPGSTAVRAEVDADLAAYWTFDEMSGTRVGDISGNEYHGTVVEGRPDWDYDGKYGGCMDFDGTYGVKIPAGLFSNISTAVTISMWVKGQVNQPDRECVLLQAGTRKDQENHPVINVYADWKDGEVSVATGYEDDQSETWSDATVPDWAGQWNHYAFVSDTDDPCQLIYHNGQEVSEGTAHSAMTGITEAFIGMGAEGERRHYIGQLDDIRIYSRALSPQEIAELYMYDPVPPELKGTVERSQELSEQKPQQAIAFIKSKIETLKQLGNNNPQRYLVRLPRLSFDLHFLLAKAQKAAGYPDGEVETSYRQALEQGMPSLAGFASVLLWLFEGENTQEYQQVVGSLLDGDEDYLKDVARRAGALIESGKLELALDFLETNLSTYLQWRQSHPYDQVDAETSLPAVYFQLAGAQEAAGLGNEQIAEAYGKTFCGLDERHTDRQSKALMWLLENDCREVYAQIIELSRQSGPFESDYKRVIRRLCGRLESENNWVIFERLLDRLLADETYPFEWVGFVTSCLGSQGGDWSEKYFAYLESKGELRFAKDCMAAEKHAAEGNYGKAAQLYQDIANRCARDNDKRVYQLQLSKCLFKAGKYREAASGFERFVAAGPGAARAQMREAILTKGQCHIRLGEIDQALDEFFRLTLEYPEARQVPEAVFYIGYCHMLQNNFTAAAGAFEVVLQEYPESKYTSQAKRYLDRMRGLAG